jgi:hypothetical protein
MRENNFENAKDIVYEKTITIGNESKYERSFEMVKSKSTNNFQR